jgi:hypothetical protein
MADPVEEEEKRILDIMVKDLAMGSELPGTFATSTSIGSDIQFPVESDILQELIGNDDLRDLAWLYD